MSDFLYYIKETLLNIGIIDVIDIVIVSFLLYYLFRFLLERRAGKPAMGIVLLLLLLLISDALNMHALNFILSNLFSVGIIALVILFQPELRSVLEKVGGDSLKSIREKMEDTTVLRYTRCIEQVVDAAEKLSQTKVGALLVFERTAKLGEYATNGTILEARPSAELIENLFVDKTPLHDGAIVIRDARIFSAGCVLPLSKNSEISRNLGTRHRAGLGISEISDAIVVIVSEETGIISVASEGVINRGFSRKKLEEYLQSQLIVKENSIKSKVKRFTGITKKKKGEADNARKTDQE